MCGAGVAAGLAAGSGRFSRKKPDMPLSIGKLDPEANPTSCDLHSLSDFEELGIQHLSEFDRLPWFEKDDSGELRLKDNSGVGPIVDTHSHVGWAFGLGRSVDMTRNCKVEYFYDYERQQDVLFKQIHPTQNEAAQMTQEDLSLFVKTPKRNRTQTAANLAAEMDRMNYGHIALLPIAVPHLPRHMKDTLNAAKMDDRFMPLGAVYPKPWSDNKVAELDRQVKEHHIKGVKYHPIFQLIAPDDPDMMKFFAWCEGNDMLVYAHTGYTGREPGFMKQKSEPQRFAKALEAFPKLRMVFAHTGVRRVDEALEVARRFEDRVWLDISGQAAPAITYILQRYNSEQVMFGSDWPFYPLAVMVARGLVATESCPNLRAQLFGENARKLFKLA